MKQYPEYKCIWIPNIDTEYCDIRTKDIHSFSCGYGWFIQLGRHQMKQYAKYIIAGWFDLMGIENGVNYIRFNRASCTTGHRS